MIPFSVGARPKGIRIAIVGTPPECAHTRSPTVDGNGRIRVDSSTQAKPVKTKNDNATIAIKLEETKQINGA